MSFSTRARDLALIAVVAALTNTEPAHAQVGINLSWNDCGTAGAQELDFDCSAGATEHWLLGSFILPQALDSFVQMLFTVRIHSSTPGLAPWWDLARSGCRGRDWYLSVGTPGPTCTEFLESSPALVSRVETVSDNQIRIIGDVAVLTPQSVPANQELYAFTIVLRDTRINECEGCCAAACIVLEQLALVETTGYGFTFTAPSSWNLASWQGGGYPAYWPGGPLPPLSCEDFGGGSCSPTAARSSTWGALKALYR